MSDLLHYKFDVPALGEKITVQLPQSQQFRRDEVFLQCVAPRISSNDLAWTEYRTMAQHNGRYFQLEERPTFDKMMNKLREDSSSFPIAQLAVVHVVSVDSDVLMQARRDSSTKSAKRGAQAVRDRVQNVLCEVFPSVGSVAFASQRGQDALRLAMETEPGTAMAGERRRKRKLPHGLTLGGPNTVRKQRADSKRQLQEREDVQYITKQGDNFVASAQCPQNDRDLHGVAFDLVAQFTRALDLDERAGELQPAREIEPGSEPQRLQLGLVIGSDGVSPSNDSILACLLRVLDPQRALFRRGHSRVLRVLLVWSKQAAIRGLAFIRNAQLSNLIHSRCVRLRGIVERWLSCVACPYVQACGSRLGAGI